MGVVTLTGVEKTWGSVFCVAALSDTIQLCRFLRISMLICV